MRNFLLGTVFGIILATVGLSGIARLLDKTVEQTKTIVQEQAK
jgi:hypothetical protein